MKPEIIIYDFDGVICHSVHVKTKAFVELYKDHSADIQSLVRQYHIDNGGISRFEKIKYYQTQLLGLPYSETEVNELAEQFAGLVKEKVIASPYVEGVMNFLEKHVSDTNQFICTGTPEFEIVEIITRKKLGYLFSGVYGSPNSKPDIIRKILSDTGMKPEQCLFFGDAITDYKAALVCQVSFVGIKNSDTIFPEGTLLIDNFNDPKLRIYNL